MDKDFKGFFINYDTIQNAVESVLKVGVNKSEIDCGINELTDKRLKATIYKCGTIIRVDIKEVQ